MCRKAFLYKPAGRRGENKDFRSVAKTQERFLLLQASKLGLAKFLKYK